MESNNEDKLILAKLNDKVKLCKTRNKIVNTEFLNLNQKNINRKLIEINGGGTYEKRKTGKRRKKG